MRTLGALLLLLLAAPHASAQVETDGSLGAEGLVAAGLLPDGSLATYLVDEGLGQRRGENVFHSFARFGVPVGATAGFTADAPTQRIVARVTGGSSSVINGRIVNAAPGADLYLMNPFGVIFSTSASLDVRGSVFVSTANALRFADGAVFPAARAEEATLTAAAPSAWGFSGATFGAVRFASDVPFGVPAGETLSGVGGTVFLRSSRRNTYSAPGGEIALAARMAAGDVPLDVSSVDARGALPDELGVVRVGPNATLDTRPPAGTASSGGRIVIRGAQLVMQGGAMFTGSPNDAGGAVEVDLETRDSIALLDGALIQVTASGSAGGGALRMSSAAISLQGASRAGSVALDSAVAGSVHVDAASLELSGASALQTFAIADGTPGGLAIDAEQIDLREGAGIVSANQGSGAARDVEIRARELRLETGGEVRGETFAAGRAAAIRIEAERLEQSSAARISSLTSTDGAGGDIDLSAGEIVLRGESGGADPGGIFSNALSSGAAGSLRITAGTIDVLGGAQISSTTSGSGRAGDIALAAARQIRLAGTAPSGPSGIFARSGFDEATAGTGRGGDVRIESPTVSVEAGAEISTRSSGDGDAGSVRILAADSVRIAGAGDARSSVNARTLRGAGGDVVIETPELSVLNGGEISVSTLDSGAAGSVRISADGVYVGGGAAALDPAGIFAQSNDQRNLVGAGDAGDVEIRVSRLLELRDGGIISAATRGAGEAGSVRISGAKKVAVRDGEISARSDETGRAGSVELAEIGTLSVGPGGRITTLTRRSAPGGRIDISASREVIVSGGEISARSEGSGDAGSIAVSAGQQLTLRDGGRITTQAETAFGGNIDLRARHLLYVQDAEITTSVDQGAGDGGNITIDPEFVVLNGGTIAARANAGNGGNILIRTDHFVADATSTVDASSQLGIDGQIEITSPEADLTGELARLEGEYLDASSQLARACAARSVERGTFAVRGGARASAPDAPLAAHDDGAAALEGCPAP